MIGFENLNEKIKKIFYHYILLFIIKKIFIWGINKKFNSPISKSGNIHLTNYKNE
jgi:hypothetical protein